MKEILGVRDLMEHTGLKETAVRKMYHAKGFPRITKSGKLLVYKDDFDAWFRGTPVTVPHGTSHTTVR